MAPATLLVLLAGAAFTLSWWLTGRIRSYALRRRILDIPNERSSHAVATPRGGGAAVALATIAGAVAAAGLGLADRRLAWALLGGGALVAGVGFLDDHGGVARRWRLLAHMAAAGWALAWLGDLPPLVAWGRLLDTSPAIYLLALMYVTWVINLTNFMDGIDGLAAVETITVAGAGAVLVVASDGGEAAAAVPMLLVAATTGFLVWNWPPARIFMGDVGSGFLGFALGVLSLHAATIAPALLWSWTILLGVFIVDATFTLLRRAARREPFYQAHRTHAYQHVALRYGAHKPVTVAVAAINLGWLLPIAWLVARGSLDGLAGVLLAYAPLLAAAVRLGAGAPPATAATHV